MTEFRVFALITVYFMWALHVSKLFLPIGSGTEIFGFSLILTAASSVAWVFGAWFLKLSELSGHRKGKAVIQGLMPISPLCIAGLPVIGERILSFEFVAAAFLIFLANFKAPKVISLIWGVKKGWRADIPDDGKVTLQDHEKIYSKLVFIYAALPIMGWVVIPLIFR